MKSRILLVTGREAASSVWSKSQGVVHVCPVGVAALMSVDGIGRELSKLNLSGFSMVIVPGLVSGDTSGISRRLGIPVYKGTKHYSDIPLLLEKLGELTLSTTIPADFIIEREMKEQVNAELNDACRNKENFVMKIGGKKPIHLGRNCPMQVVAEIPDAPLLSKEELKSKARYLVESGAGVIDLGMIAGADNSDKVRTVVKVVRSAVTVPLSVDSMNDNEILAAASAGVDLVLSIGESNLDVAGKIDVPFVLVPTDSQGRLQKDASLRVRKLESLMKTVKDKEVILDPVLSPLNNGFVESIRAYSLLKEKHPEIPALMGVGNVTELVDADSVGINALLAGMASEMGVELLFTVEASVKTKSSVRELSTAAKMMYLARKRGKNPKDLGIDLLRLKEKKNLDLIEDSQAAGIKCVKVKNIPPELEDTSYRIYLKDGEITAVQYRKSKPVKKYVGILAEALYKEVCAGERISPEHAAYLGKELAKAEIALKLGKNYVQDEELFR